MSNMSPVLMNTPTPTHLDSVRRHVDLLTTFLQEYKWLTDAYLSDYFTRNHSQHIKPSWWHALQNMDLSELACFLKPEHWQASEVWPLSLLSFRAVVHALPLSRHPVNTGANLDVLQHAASQKPKKNTTNQDSSDRISLAPGSPGAGGAPGYVGRTDRDCRSARDIEDGQCKMLEHCYRRHVKPKKQHEILILAKAVAELCGQCGCSNVVDIGAGQGHLSRLLSYGYGLHVTTVEAAGCHAPKAERFDSEVRRDISRGQCISRKKRKKLKEGGADSALEMPVIRGPGPNHVVAWIDSDISVSDFLTQVSRVQQGQLNTEQCPPQSTGPRLEQGADKGSRTPTTTCTKSQESACCLNIAEDAGSDHAPTAQCRDQAGTGTPHFVLTGLHACGDLTPTMLRVFVACPQAAALAAVGCCYMKIDIHDPDRGDRELGYPLSTHLAGLQDHTLSWEAREMACHFIDAYYARLTEAYSCPNGEAVAHLRTHCYRAALQEVVADKDPGRQHGSIKLTLKKTHRLPFTDYAEKALQRLGLDPSLSSAQVERAHGRLAAWRDVVAFYVLRLSLAPLVESLILLDRVLYLAECGISSTLLPVFDPAISPRNFVLLAAKGPDGLAGKPD